MKKSIQIGNFLLNLDQKNINSDSINYEIENRCNKKLRLVSLKLTKGNQAVICITLNDGENFLCITKGTKSTPFPPITIIKERTEEPPFSQDASPAFFAFRLLLE